MSVQACNEEIIAEQLLELIRPHYKGLRGPGQPEFKKSMKGDEIEALLIALHAIVMGIRQRGNGHGS
jgi:hypothetical protein